MACQNAAVPESGPAALGEPPTTRAEPTPPYTAVIFTSTLSPDDLDGYAAAAERMLELAARQAGFLGIDSVRDPQTLSGITVSYWADETSARAWKQVQEHLAAQDLGRSRWYRDYQVHVATVTRRYGRSRPDRTVQEEA